MNTVMGGGGGGGGGQCTHVMMSWKEIDDLEFPYDIALLYVNYQQIKDKDDDMLVFANRPHHP